MAKKSAFLSGFCGIGCHEGTKPRNVWGNPLVTCTSLDICECSCHKDIDLMFEMAGRPRIPVENPEYIPDRGNYIIPTREDVIAARITPENKPAVIQRPLEVTQETEFAATRTGIRAKGQLEDQVLVVCGKFSRGELEVELLTPAAIAEQISRDAPPSVGAISAVFDRWMRIGFAACAKKPVRFESFTREGLELGLSVMKEQFKVQQKRSEKTAVNRRMGVGG